VAVRWAALVAEGEEVAVRWAALVAEGEEGAEGALAAEGTNKDGAFSSKSSICKRDTPAEADWMLWD
jgi:hypothetical protein